MKLTTWLAGSIARACAVPDKGQALDSQEQRRLVLVQFCNLASVGMMLWFAALYALVDWQALHRPALLSLACIPLYLLSFRLNRRGRHLLAKLLLFGTLSGSILLSTALFIGKAPGEHFFFLTAALLPLLIWSLEWPGWILGFMGFNIGGFLFIQFRPAEPVLLAGAFPPAWLPFFNIMSIVASYGVTLVILVLFQRRADADAQTLQEKARLMEELMHQFQELSNTDSLTSLHNRRAMLFRLEEERARLNRVHSTFSLLMADIDLFKEINDRHGHEAGDAVLVQLGRLLRGSLRDIDHVARWGGEEFLILLPDTGMEGALVVAEKIRQKVDQGGFAWEGQHLACTVTIGVAVHSLSQTKLDETIRQADAALYRGKARGRNQVASAG